jgi:hypothetical protein
VRRGRDLDEAVSRRSCALSAVALLFAALVVAPALRAQGASARIEGVVIDSVHAKPAPGAIVLLTRISPEPSEFRSALTDGKGRFHFDSLVAGRYTVAFATPYLDSLSLSLPPQEVDLADGQKGRVDFATPSGPTLRAAACPGIELTHGSGAIIGRVSDADSDAPLPGARVAVSWTELSVDSALHPVTTQRGGIVKADSLGRYRLCGVPTNSWLMVQVQDGGRAGSVLTLTVDDDGGVLARDLSLSARSARSLASLDSAAAATDTTATRALLTGTATLTGTVRDASGHPLAETQVRIRGAAGVTRTDSSGRFLLASQPAGSQLVETRHVGYLLGQAPVELRSGKSVDVDVTLRRIVSLDSIRVVARRSWYPDFEARRKQGFGRFLDEAAIEKLHPMETSDLFRDRVPGFQVTGEGLDTKLWTTHGKFDMSNLGKSPCEVNVVVDGVQHQDINLLDPLNIGAVEAYPGPPGAPPQYDSACGVIVIWTKRGGSQLRNSSTGSPPGRAHAP